MPTFRDVPADLLIPPLASRLVDTGHVAKPEWAEHVKTGVHRERPPVQEDWWEVRGAAVLRKIGVNGKPVGVNHLAQQYGGPKDRGGNPNRAKAGSRHVIRTLLQQLESADLVTVATNLAGTVKLGRVLTPSGQQLLDEIAREVLPAAIEEYPQLAKY